MWDKNFLDTKLKIVCSEWPETHLVQTFLKSERKNFGQKKWTKNQFGQIFLAI